MADINQIKKLREKTGAGIMDCRKALDHCKGSQTEAEKILLKWGVERAEKKTKREVGQGIVESYVHASGKIGVLVSLLCETDFVAKTDEFKYLAHEVAMQIAAMKPKDVKALTAQEYIRDPKITIEDLVKQTIGKLGENIKIKDFSRLEI